MNQAPTTTGPQNPHGLEPVLHEMGLGRSLRHRRRLRRGMDGVGGPRASAGRRRRGRGQRREPDRLHGRLHDAATVGVGVLAFAWLRGWMASLSGYSLAAVCGIVLGASGAVASAVGLGLLPDFASSSAARWPPGLRDPRAGDRGLLQHLRLASDDVRRVDRCRRRPSTSTRSFVPDRPAALPRRSWQRAPTGVVRRLDGGPRDGIHAARRRPTPIGSVTDMVQGSSDGGPQPPPPGVSILITSPACRCTVHLSGNRSARASSPPGNSQFSPAAPGSPPASPTAAHPSLGDQRSRAVPPYLQFALYPVTATHQPGTAGSPRGSGSATRNRYARSTLRGGRRSAACRVCSVARHVGGPT